jgi:hypothetical protein
MSPIRNTFCLAVLLVLPLPFVLPDMFEIDLLITAFGNEIKVLDAACRRNSSQ